MDPVEPPTLRKRSLEEVEPAITQVPQTAPTAAGAEITERDYQRAKRRAVLLPIVILVGGIGAMAIGSYASNAERSWGNAAQKIVFLVTAIAGGYLARSASFLKTRPYQTYKQRRDLENYRRDKSLRQEITPRKTPRRQKRTLHHTRG